MLIRNGTKQNIDRKTLVNNPSVTPIHKTRNDRIFIAPKVPKGNVDFGR